MGEPLLMLCDSSLFLARVPNAFGYIYSELCIMKLWSYSCHAMQSACQCLGHSAHLLLFDPRSNKNDKFPQLVLGHNDSEYQ